MVETEATTPTPREQAEAEYQAARVAYHAAVEAQIASPTPANKGKVTKADNRLTAAYRALNPPPPQDQP